MTKRPKNLTANARYLRNNMTKQEVYLWAYYLKHLNLVVRRQRQIGNYIVDFYIPSCKLVIEIDGGQHYSDSAMDYDCNRQRYMENLGIHTIRYTNLDIDKNFEGVCQDIDKHIKQIIDRN